MNYDPQKHHRRSIRLKGYDYARPGGYFVTIVTHGRECLFGAVVDGEMRLNALGETVREEWFRTADVRPYVVLYENEFVVMPNHIHGIIWIVDDDVGATRPVGTTRPVGATRPVGTTRPVGATRPVVGATRRVAPTPTPTQTGPTPGSIGAIIGQFKSIVTKRINRYRGTPGVPVWQRNYYDHIIRNENDWRRIRAYIVNNPANWARDRNNSTAR